MFTNLIKDATSTSSYNNIGLLISFGIALLIGFLLAICYLRQSTGSKNFAVALVLMPTIVALMILMVSGNLGAGVAVAGTFGLIRFRSAKGSAMDIVLIFLATAAGIACGMGYAVLGLIFTAVMCTVFLILTLSSFGDHGASPYRELRILIPENIDYTEVFDDIFSNYTKSVSLTKVCTTNLGSMFELTYSLRLKDIRQEKAMMDEIRTRNGNLTVICARTASAVETL